MQNINTIIQEILDLVDEDSEVTHVEIDGVTKSIIIEKRKRILFCPSCGNRLYSKGKIIRHPNNPVLNDFSELKIELIGRRWKCSNDECNYTCTDSFQFIEPNKKEYKAGSIDDSTRHERHSSYM